MFPALLLCLEIQQSVPQLKAREEGKGSVPGPSAPFLAVKASTNFEGLARQIGPNVWTFA